MYSFFFMTKERIEHISIIMEMIAFFFVTIDLYGKERLTRLKVLLGSLKPRDFKRYLEDKLNPNTSSFVLALTLYYLMSPFFFLVGIVFLWAFQYLGNQLITYLFSTVNISIVKLVMFVYVVACSYFIVKFFFDSWIKLVSRILQAILFVTKPFSIQGMMLFIGAALFIAAKIMQFIAV